MLGTGRIREFARDERGVFAIIFGLMAVVLIAVGGSAVDYTFWMQARGAAQEAADAAALGASASSAETEAELTDVADALIGDRLSMWAGVELESISFDPQTNRVTTEISGTVPSIFVGLVGVHDLPVVATSTAERATNGELELALVLDNTWSMSDSDGSGSTKIASLKAAANNLLDAIWEEDNEHIRVGLVPYAEYVNVGLANRNAAWITVPADTSTTTTTTTTTPAQPKVCETKTTKGQTCTKGAPKTCSTTTDGVVSYYDCTPQTCTPNTVPPYESCTGPTPEKTTTSTKTTTNKWYGCVYSRIPRNLRLSDAEPTTKYIGFIGTSTKCLTEVVPLTDNQQTVRNAINAMVVNVGTYKPYTHIPSGMIWGVNVLSPTEPFAQGDAYDTDNVEPRKALVLMTDGDNTYRYNSSNGQHIAISGTAAQIATYKTGVDADTTAICTYAKGKNIEVFVVSFGVLKPDSNTMLRGCATDLDHYYSATNAEDLNDAFEDIADQLRVVRIVR